MGATAAHAACANENIEIQTGYRDTRLAARNAIICLFNEERAKLGIYAASKHDTLMNVAQKMAESINPDGFMESMVDWSYCAGPAPCSVTPLRHVTASPTPKGIVTEYLATDKTPLSPYWRDIGVGVMPRDARASAPSQYGVAIELGRRG